MNEFNISCYIDAKTYMDFAKFHRFKTNKSIFNLFFFPMLLIIFALFNLLLHNNWIAILLVCLASIIPCWTLGLFYLETNAKIRDFDLKKNPRVFYKITLTNSNIRIKNKKEQATYDWNQVDCVFYTEKYVYLYFTKVNAFILPTKVLDSKKTLDLYTILDENISKNKQIKKFISCQEDV